MQTHPHLVAGILVHAKSLRVTAESGLAAEPEDAAKAPSKDASMPPQKSGTVLDKLRARLLQRQYSQVVQLPVADLRDILFVVEPITFSPFNIKALARRGARDIAKSELSKCLEYTTGVAGTANLDQGWSNMAQLAEHLRHLSDSRGRLGASLNLPPNWEEYGIFTLRRLGAPDVVQVTRKLKNTTKNVHLAQYGFKLEDGDSPKLSIKQNWSENQAAIVEEGGLGSCLLCLQFAACRSTAPALTDVTPPPKRAKTSPSSAHSKLAAAAAGASACGGQPASSTEAGTEMCSDEEDESKREKKAVGTSLALEAQEAAYEPPLPQGQ